MWALLPQQLQQRRQRVEQAVSSLARQLERLTEAYLSGVMKLEEYKRRRSELEQHEQALTGQVKELAAQAHRQVETNEIMKSMEAFCGRVSQGLRQATFEQRRLLVELLIDRVVVTNEEVEIRYVIPTSPSSENIRFCHLRSDYLSFVYIPGLPRTPLALGAQVRR